MKTKKKNRNMLYLGLLILVTAVVIFISTVHFYQTLQNQLFRERQSHLTEMTVKISEVIDVTIETMQEKVDVSKSFLEYSDVTADTIDQELDEITQIMCVDDGVLFALDDQGRYYSSEGNEGRWSNMEDLVTADTEPVIRDLRVFQEKTSCMVFFAPLDDTIELAGSDSTLTRMALAIPMSRISEYLTISMFGDSCYTYLINNQGRRLYKQTFSAAFIEEYNVISALSADHFLMGGSSQELMDAVNGRESCCLEFKESRSGENYFVSSVPVEGSQWTVLLFVPTGVLGIQSSQFMKTVFYYFVGIAMAAAIVFGCLILAVNINRTDKRMLEQQRKSNELLEQAAEEARSANAAKSEFLAHMSHDIRTPINGIIGMTNIATKHQDDPERVDDCLRKISGAADHLLTLINDVLDMSSIESGKVVISREPMDLRLLIQNCISILDGQLLSRDLQLVKQFEELPHPYVYGDELHLRQVFINILGNAVKFTPDGGSIYFRIKETGYQDGKVSYRFEVEDTGIGISEEFQGKIFDEFSQEKGGSRTTYQGTGLGMAISKQFIELMGGKIGVRSKLGVGTCFTVDLIFDEDEELHEKETGGNVIDLHGMKVMLVEDNELNMEIAREILTEEGLIITEAVNGQVAVDLFTTSPAGTFDAILMDVMMPVLNGYEATQAIRASAHPQAQTIPIIAMTANAYRQDVEKAKEVGMNDHVPKPIDIELLLSVLERYRHYAERQSAKEIA